MSQSTAEAAQSILAGMRRSYSAPYTMVSVDAAEFRHLTLDAYRVFQSALEAQGFMHVADLEILEESHSPTTLMARTMIRSMRSANGHVTADYYQVKPRICRRLKILGRGLLNLRLLAAPRNFMKGMKTQHCIGFETEFTDGNFLITSNAEGASLLSGPPTIECIYFPYGTPGKVLLDAHMNRLEEIVSAKKGRMPAPVRSLPDLLQMQKRQRAQKVAYRASVQWVTKAELQNMSSGNLELANEVFSEVQKLLAQDGI
jgi:hypothetical protein